MDAPPEASTEVMSPERDDEPADAGCDPQLADELREAIRRKVGPVAG